MSDTVSRKEFEKLKEQVDKISSSTVKKAPRKPSEYNIFIGEECKKIRKKNKDLPHTEVFKMAIEKWNSKKQ